VSFEGSNPSPATECVRGPLTSGNAGLRPSWYTRLGYPNCSCFGGHQVRLPQACDQRKRVNRTWRCRVTTCWAYSASSCPSYGSSVPSSLTGTTDLRLPPFRTRTRSRSRPGKAQRTSELSWPRWSSPFLCDPCPVAGRDRGATPGGTPTYRHAVRRIPVQGARHAWKGSPPFARLALSRQSGSVGEHDVLLLHCGLGLSSAFRLRWSSQKT
jgi:hypothetical protein